MRTVFNARVFRLFCAIRAGRYQGLPRDRFLMRYRLIHYARCAPVALALIGTTALAMAPQIVPTSAQMVLALNSVYSAHARSRANHAKGVLVQALFTPATSAAAISRAPHFSGAASPVLVRFSTFGGTPDIADSDPGAAPYGMALKFSLGHQGETDLVMHSYNGFPSATAAEFTDFMTAKGHSEMHRFGGQVIQGSTCVALPPERAFGSRAIDECGFDCSTHRYSRRSPSRLQLHRYR